MAKLPVATAPQSATIVGSATRAAMWLWTVGALCGLASSSRAQVTQPIVEAPPEAAEPASITPAPTGTPTPRPPSTRAHVDQPHPPSAGRESRTAPTPTATPTREAPRARAGSATPPVPPPMPDPDVTGDHPLDNGRSRFRLGKGLEFASQDGDFAMIPRLRAQFFYAVSAEDGAPARQSLMIRRARLQFSGHMWGANIKYKAELAFSPRDLAMHKTEDGGPGTSPLLDWYLDFTHWRDLSLRLGQYKVPFSRQRVISSGDLQLVDRSIANARFNVDRDLGLDLRSSDLFGLELLRYYVGIYVGEGRNTFEMNDFGMMYLARLEILPMGGFRDYKEGVLLPHPSPKLSIGVAGAYLDRAKRDRGILGTPPADGGTTDVRALAADVMFKFLGVSVFSEFFLRNGARNPGNARAMGVPVEPTPPPDGWGWMAQGGYVLPGTTFELAGRGGLTEPIGRHSSLEAEREFGGGLSYYFALHAWKLQADYFHLVEGRGDNRLTEDRVRVQLQASY